MPNGDHIRDGSETHGGTARAADLRLVGYLVLDDQGGIVETDVAAAALLACQRARLVARSLSPAGSAPHRMLLACSGGCGNDCVAQASPAEPDPPDVQPQPDGAVDSPALRVRFVDVSAQQRELEEKNAELERFLYTISHDLKSPLVTIVGFCDTLREALRAGDQRHVEHDLSHIEEAAGHMSRLLDELLRVARAGRPETPAGNVSLVAAATEVLKRMSGRVSEIGARVLVSPDLPVVHGDPVRISELLQNLLDNALKFSRDRVVPQVEIGVRNRDGEPVVFVRDNGVGIAPDQQARIFDLFTKLDPEVEGTGVGLAIVRRIAQVHGGRVWVESAGAMQGASFCFTLPIAAPGEGR
jgi:signal transduction histidine kinase